MVRTKPPSLEEGLLGKGRSREGYVKKIHLETEQILLVYIMKRKIRQTYKESKTR